MCKGSAGRFGSGERNECGCACSCPATMSVEEEIQLLEEQRKYMQDRAVMIDRKIAALKSAQES
jgi:hypothetical protein